MADDFFVEQSEQSQIKAAIVTDYFWAWAGFMVKQRKLRPQYGEKLAYIDLFAGPGRYESGAKSTPVMIMEKAVSDPEIRDRLVAIFNDKDEANTKSLEQELAAIPEIEKLKYAPVIETGEVDEGIIKQFRNARLVPTFLFVDPFGYKGLSLQLVNSVLKDWGCDCVFFFNYNRISMGLGNDAVEPHMNALFGEERANRLRERFNDRLLNPGAREMVIVEQMTKALEEMGGRFVLPFRFRNAAGSRTTHHLFFVSKSFRGYAIMREVMYKHSHKDGAMARFEYNPATKDSPTLFELTRPLGDLEDMLLQDLAGQSFVGLDGLFEKHSAGKGYVIKNYREVLCRMEQEGKVQMVPASPPRRKGTIGKDVKIIFPGRTSE